MRINLGGPLLLYVIATSCGSSPPPAWAVPVSSEGLSAQCDSGDAKVCAALMQQANTPAEFSHYGELACKHGETVACEYLGNMAFVKSRAPRGSESAAALSAHSKNMYEIGCQHGAWYSCVLVAEMGQDVELMRKANALTEVACLEQGTHEACEMLARSYQDAQQPDKMRSIATDGCRAFLANATEANWSELRKSTRICEMATKLGVPADTLLPIMRGRGTARVPSTTIEARRTSGDPQIHPPRAVTYEMHRKGPKQAGAEFRLCLSPQGRISDINLTISSGFPLYDRKLFEGMQRWRYSPYLEDGNPAPVCTSVTIFYLQP